MRCSGTLKNCWIERVSLYSTSVKASKYNIKLQQHSRRAVLLSKHLWMDLGGCNCSEEPRLLILLLWQQRRSRTAYPSCCAFLGGSMSCFRASRKRHRPWISLHNHSDTAEIYITLMRYFIYSIRVEESWSLEWFVWFHMLPTVTFHLQQNHLLSFTLLVY